MKPDAYSKITSLKQGDKIFSSVLFKDIFLNDLLGDDNAEILYFEGRNLAQKFSTGTLAGIEDFFRMAGWGDLKIQTQNPNNQIWELSGDGVAASFLAVENPVFYLQSGFIAQQISQQLGKKTEASYKVSGADSVIINIEIED